MAKHSRSFKTLILASGNAATALVGLLIAVILSRHFDKLDYATYRQTLLIYEFASPLLALGLPTALFYFLPGEASRARAILLENVIFLGLMGLLFSLFLALGGNLLLADRFSNPALQKTLLVFALYPALFLPASAVQAVLVVRGHIRWLTFHTLGTRLTRLGLVVLAIWLLPDSPVAAVGAITLSGLLVFASALPLMFRAIPPGESNRPTRRGLTAQLKFAVPIGLATMLESMALGIDKVLVSALCSPEQFAVFVNGAMEIPFIAIITGAATAVILPEIVAYYKEGNKAAALALWQRSARKVSLLILPAGGLLFVVAPEMMTLLYSSEYFESSDPFRIYLLLLPARLVFFGAIFQAAGRSDLILKRAVGTLILNAVVSYPMVRIFGIDGAAWGTVLVFWAYVIPSCVKHCSRLLEIRWVGLMPYRYLGLIMLALTGATLVALQVRPHIGTDAPLLSGAIASAVYLAILSPAIMLICRKELKEQWLELRQRLARIRNRS